MALNDLSNELLENIFSRSIHDWSRNDRLRVWVGEPSYWPYSDLKRFALVNRKRPSDLRRQMLKLNRTLERDHQKMYGKGNLKMGGAANK